MPTITVVHGGQTGVDRGAHDGAIANGWAVAGFMPHDARDEHGAIPADVARHLRPHAVPGKAARTRANVETSHAALVVVQDAQFPMATPGTGLTIDLLVDRMLRCLVVDPSWDPTAIARWLYLTASVVTTPATLALPFPDLAITAPPTLRLMIAGPRASKWPDGHARTADLLRALVAPLAALRAAAEAA